MSLDLRKVRYFAVSSTADLEAFFTCGLPLRPPRLHGRR